MNSNCRSTSWNPFPTILCIFWGIWLSQNDYLSLLDRLFFRLALILVSDDQTREKTTGSSHMAFAYWSFHCAINQCWLIQRSQINSVHWKNKDVYCEIALTIQMKQQQHFIRKKWVNKRNIPFVFAPNEVV